MRVIKFRAKGGEFSIEKNKWIIGAGIYRDCEITFIIVDDETATNMIGAGNYETNFETVGQFTGLTDRNGKEIYEGDILGGNWKTKVVVSWNDYACRFVAQEIGSNVEHEISYYCNHISGTYAVEAEIVGNIYDNPELLEVQK